MSQNRHDGPDMTDPIAIWRSFRDANLDAWAKGMTSLVNTDAFAQAMGMQVDNYLVASAPFQEAIEKYMESYLAQLNMPSRVEVVSLAERMTNIEMRLDDLDAKTDDMVDGLKNLAAASDADDSTTAIAELETRLISVDSRVEEVATSLHAALSHQADGNTAATAELQATLTGLEGRTSQLVDTLQSALGHQANASATTAEMFAERFANLDGRVNHVVDTVQAIQWTLGEQASATPNAGLEDKLANLDSRIEQLANAVQSSSQQANGSANAGLEDKLANLDSRIEQLANAVQSSSQQANGSANAGLEDKLASLDSRTDQLITTVQSALGQQANGKPSPKRTTAGRGSKVKNTTEKAEASASE